MRTFPTASSPLWLNGLSPSIRSLTLLGIRLPVLEPLAECPNCTTEQIDKAATSLQVSRATIYRLLTRYKQNREATSLLPETPGRKRGSKELKPVQERIVQESIRGFFLSQQRPTVAVLSGRGTNARL